MKPTDEQLNMIAEELETGQVCFFHQENGSIECYPDLEEMDVDMNPWQDIIDKVQADIGNYTRIEKMDSRDGFRVMEDFADSLEDLRFGKKLFRILSDRRPFANFKYEVEHSDYRQDWFDFRRQAHIEWVKRQLH